MICINPHCLKPIRMCRCDDPTLADPTPPPLIRNRERVGHKAKSPEQRGIYEFGGRYVVRLRWKGELCYLGRFDTLAEAKRAKEQFYLNRWGLFWREIIANNSHYATNTKQPQRPKRPKRPRVKCEVSQLSLFE